jgi:hypothetical protein
MKKDLGSNQYTRYGFPGNLLNKDPKKFEQNNQKKLREQYKGKYKKYLQSKIIKNV